MHKAPFFIILSAFLVNTFGPIPTAQADEFRLPAPGVMVHLSPEFNPPILKGIKVRPDNPFRFDFILDQGDSNSVVPAKAGPHTGHSQELGIQKQEQLKQEATKLIKYFLASLTIPEKDLWVNLSPYEKDRIIPNSFGLTEMGRDLLAEDYMLKQITASLIYPEDGVGKKFWKRVYQEAQSKYGTTNIPVNTFNKVWIVPEKAVVYENAKAGTAYVVESKLKVMLEQDYLALQKHTVVRNDMASVGANIVRAIVIPELTKEVNEGKNFAQLRQVYNSLIMATWYKKKIKDSLLAQVYADKNKTVGVQYTSTVIPAKAGIQINDVEAIYQRYLQAFKKGVYNYIKEDQDPLTQQIIPRKYFSGGTTFDAASMAKALSFTADRAVIAQPASGRAQEIDVEIDRAMVDMNQDRAMKTPSPFNDQDRGAARTAFEQVREAVNAQKRLQPFVFYHSRIYLDDMYGGPAMFESLIKFLENNTIRNHYDLKSSQQTEVISPEETLTQFKKDLEPLEGIGSQLNEIMFYLREQTTTKYDGSGIGGDKILPFLNKYFMNDSFSNGNIIQFLKYLQHNFGLWQRPLDSLTKDNMNKFLHELLAKGFFTKDNSPFIVAVPELIRVLKNKGFVSDEEGQELNEKWSKLKEKYFILNNIPSSDLGRDPSGKKIFVPGQPVRRYIPGGDIGKFVGEYYELTSAIYPLLSKAFFAIADDIEGRDYLPQGENAAGFGENWQIRSLQRGYYRDWNNVWQGQNKSKQPSQAVNFFTFDGDMVQLKDVFEKHPEKMVDVFILAAQKGLFIDEPILEAIRTVKIKGDKAVYDLVGESFVKLMGIGRNIAPLLIRMHETGLLDQILPELAELNGHLSFNTHRFLLTYHTLHLLYYFENGMPDLLEKLGKKDVYQRVKDSFPSRLILRFSMLLHDAQKDPEYQLLGRPHTIEGANSLTYQVLARFPKMEFYKDWIAWLVWHHQDLNTMGQYSPGLPGTFSHRDLLDIVSYDDVEPPANSHLMDIWYFLTIADAYSVDPDPVEGKDYLYPQVHDLHTNLIKYYSQSDPEEKEKIKAKWSQLADQEDRGIKDFYKNRMSVSDIRRAFATFKPFVSDDTLNEMEQKLTAEVKESHKLGDISLGQMLPGSYFIKLYDEYAKLLSMIYLRKLNVKNGVDMAHEMIMYGLTHDSSDPNLVLSRADQISTGLGSLFNLTVNVNKDREGMLSKMVGLMTALGLNIIHSQVRTLVKEHTNQKFIVDQLEGYFLPGEVRFEDFWPGLKQLLIEKGIKFPKSIEINELGRPDIKEAIPILLKSLLTDQGGQGLTIDDIFKLPGAVTKFKKQQKYIKTTATIEFLPDIKRVSSLFSIKTPDRNGFLMSILDIAEAFGFNIGPSPITTGPAGASNTFMLTKKLSGQENGRPLTFKEKKSFIEWVTYLSNFQEDYNYDYLQKAVKYIKDGKNLKQFLKEAGPPDLAMSTSVNPGKGGIDLTPANMHLQTKMDSRFRGNDSEGIKFHLDSAQLAQLQNAPGFVPVIITIRPMTDLELFLGLK